MNQSWKAGVAVVDITPPVDIELAGYVAREQGLIGIHDALHAKGLVLEDGLQRAAVLTCDLLGVNTDDVRFVRKRIEEKTGIPANNIMIVASHTHSGPATLHTNGIGERDEQWMATLLDKMISCVENAARTLEEVTLRMAVGVGEIGINRRGKIPEGEINPLPDPSGPVDRNVSVICLDRVRTKRPWVVLFNFGCHPTVLGAENRLVSADFVGAAVQYVERELGYDSVAMFTNGGAGNVNPVQTGSFDLASRLGESLGAEVVNIVLQPGVELGPNLQVSRTSVNFPFASIPSIEGAKDLVQKYAIEVRKMNLSLTSRKIAEACMAWSKKLKRDVKEGNLQTMLTVEVQRITLGTVSLIAVPAEVFAETTLFLKEKSKGRRIIVGYANGNVGYLPPREEIAKGGYEVLEAHKYYGYPTHFAPEAEEGVRAAAVL